MKLRIAVLFAGAGLLSTVAGCGADDASRGDRSPSVSASPTASASASASASPSTTLSPGTTTAPPSNPTPPTATPPTGPPRKPSDTVVAGWVVGTVTGASSGPCYGLVTDEGKQYALHSSEGFKVNKGDRLRVRTGRLAIKIYCGPGEHAAVKQYQLIR
jgi:hypothetical protein